MLNSREIDRLRPDVAQNCRVLLARCRAEGLAVLVTGTVRDDAFQLQCYKKGTGGKPPATFHSVKAGLAFDICKNVKGQEYADAGFFARVGAIGKSLGFTWGGDWKSVDKPHFQWDQAGKFTGRDIIAGRLPPPMPVQTVQEEGAKSMTKEEVKALVEEEVQEALQAAERRYDSLEQLPSWARASVEKLCVRGVLQGEGALGLGLSYEQLRLLVLLDRLGLCEQQKPKEQERGGA